MLKTDVELFVSLAGNDRWSGRLPEPNWQRTDGPLRTLEAAQKAVRRLMAGLKSPVEIRVRIRGGTYELMRPWVLTAKDSGYPRREAGLAQTWPVTWAAYPGEQPVLSGGRRISGPWRRETVNGREVWVTGIPDVAAGRWTFRQLWVNGQRRHRPRLPKRGVWQVTRALDADFSKPYLNGGSSRFQFKPGELRADWRNLRDVELQFFGWWVAPRVWLTAVDEARCIASFDRNSMLRLAWSEGNGVDYRVENVFEALTEPGEWYLDRPKGKLYYMPLPGEDLATAEVIAPRLSSLMQINGAANLRFEGLTFAYNEWRHPAGFADSNQASQEVPGALVVQRADNCVFHRCRVQHTNTYGVEIQQGTTETVLNDCELRDLGAGGVRIWHGCRRNVVTDCEIADGGHDFPAGVGVLVGKSSGNRVEHNHIHDFFYTGISVGWNWGYNESDAYGNLIEWNHIHDIGKGLLSDMGGIYLLGHAAGTRLRYNHIHDVVCRAYGGWCIYTDEGSTDVLIESNLCYNASRDVFHQHYGRNNQVRNNIFAYGREAVVAYGKQEPHLGVVFESNILLSRNTPILKGAGPDRWTPAQTVFRRNLYWCENGPVTFDRGGVTSYGSQPFPKGYRAEAARFAVLGRLPAIKNTPRATDWKRAKVLDRFYTRSGMTTASPGTGEIRFLCCGHTLFVRGVFKRPASPEQIAGVLWNREHLELFLKPFSDRPALAQFGVASDGEMAVLGHDCEIPATFDWHAQAIATKTGWQATLQIPLRDLATAAGWKRVLSWRCFVGFATLPERGNWSGWQAQGHDPAGRVADPLFVDPQHADFRLRAKSPALAMGFEPFDSPQAGRRKPA